MNEVSYSPRQRRYLYDLKKWNIQKTTGEIVRYDPLLWQEEYHVTCMLCFKDDLSKVKDRFVYKSRKIGATVTEMIDILNCASYFNNTDFPFTSISSRTGINPMKWAKILCDNAEIEVDESESVPIWRDPKWTSQILLENGSRLFECPGQSPSSIRSFGTPKPYNDEFGIVPYQLAEELYTSTRGSIAGLWTQHDITSTMPLESDHFFNQMVDMAEEQGFMSFCLPMFPIQFYDEGLDMLEQVDQEYLEYMTAGDEKNMRKLCNQAWAAGMWKVTGPPEDCEHLKYYGLWPEDRGLIPLVFWWDLIKRAYDFSRDLSLSMREYMCSQTKATGTFLSDQLISKIAVIPVRYKKGPLWAYELEGNGAFVYYLGWDFASKKHKACASMWREGRESLDQVYVELFDKMASPQQRKRLLELLIAFPTTRGIGIDSTGVGQPFFEECVDMYHKGLIKTTLVSFDMRKKIREEYYKGEEVRIRLDWACAYNFKRLAEQNPPGVRILNDLVIKKDFKAPKEADLKSTVDTKTGSHADIAWSGFIGTKVRDLISGETIRFSTRDKHLIKRDFIDPVRKAELIMDGKFDGYRR